MFVYQFASKLPFHVCSGQSRRWGILCHGLHRYLMSMNRLRTGIWQAAEAIYKLTPSLAHTKKRVLSCAAWNNTPLSKALTMEIDCLETLWGQKKIKAFLKEWLKIFIAILCWWLFSADMGHSCTCLCEERKTKMNGFLLYHYLLLALHSTIHRSWLCKAFFWILVPWSQS